MDGDRGDLLFLWSSYSGPSSSCLPPLPSTLQRAVPQPPCCCWNGKRAKHNTIYGLLPSNTHKVKACMHHQHSLYMQVCMPTERVLKGAPSHQSCRKNERARGLLAIYWALSISRSLYLTHVVGLCPTPMTRSGIGGRRFPSPLRFRSTICLFESLARQPKQSTYDNQARPSGLYVGHPTHPTPMTISIAFLLRPLRDIGTPVIITICPHCKHVATHESFWRKNRIGVTC
jgi:hypothetical protein